MNVTGLLLIAYIFFWY